MSDRYYISMVSLDYYLNNLSIEDKLLEEEILNIKKVIKESINNYHINLNNNKLLNFDPNLLTDKEIFSKSTFCLRTLLETNKELKNEIEDLLYYMKRNHYKEGVLKK